MSRSYSIILIIVSSFLLSNFCCSQYSSIRYLILHLRHHYRLMLNTTSFVNAVHLPYNRRHRTVFRNIAIDGILRMTLLYLLLSIAICRFPSLSVAFAHHPPIWVHVHSALDRYLAFIAALAIISLSPHHTSPYTGPLSETKLNGRLTSSTVQFYGTESLLIVNQGWNLVDDVVLERSRLGYSYLLSCYRVAIIILLLPPNYHYQQTVENE